MLVETEKSATDKFCKSKVSSTKRKQLETCIFDKFLYGYETRIVTKDWKREIIAFERKCCRKISLESVANITNDTLAH